MAASNYLTSLVLPVLALALQASAQGNPLATIVSEAYSVYTEATSIWESDASAASASASSSEATSTSSSSTLSTSTTSAASSTSSASAANQVASQTASAATSTSTPSSAPSHGSSNGSRILPIVLGCVLGLVVLGLLALLLLLCLRRRRRRNHSRQNVLSPSEDEVSSWRQNRSLESAPEMSQSRNSLLAHNDASIATVSGAPNVADHPAYRNRNVDNPFVPEPPAPRRMAPNSRAGLTDASVPGDEPYVTDSNTGDPVRSRPVSGRQKSVDSGRNHHRSEAIAAGVGGAAIGAAALHHHHQNQDAPSIRRDHEPGLRQGANLNRKDDEGHRLMGRRSQLTSSATLSPVSPIEEGQTAYQPLHPSIAATEDPSAPNQMSSAHSGSHSRGHSLSRDLAAGGAGAALGAAAAHHRNKSNDRSADGRHNNNIGIGPHKHYIGDDIYSIPYNAAEQGDQPNIIGRIGQPNSIPQQPANVSGPSDPTSNSSQPAVNRLLSREAQLSSGLAGAGVSAEAAAASRSKSRSRSRSRRRSFHNMIVTHRPESDFSTSSSSEPPEMPPLHGDEAHRMSGEIVNTDDLPPTPRVRSRRSSSLGRVMPSNTGGTRSNYPPIPTAPSHFDHNSRRRDQTPPAMTSRSPKRTRFSDVPYDTPKRPNADFSGNPAPDSFPGGLGDSRYPHMGPRVRRNTSEFDAAVPLRNESQINGAESNSSEDSTWRLSSGMPGGWNRDAVQRHSMDSNTQHPSRASGMFPSRDRDSGLGASAGTGSRAGSMTSVSGANNNGGRRLRLADVRRQEEERQMREQGRKSMEAEWAGNGGYDGYDYHHHPQGVGQAL